MVRLEGDVFALFGGGCFIGIALGDDVVHPTGADL